jgi:hypothetical protein
MRSFSYSLIFSYILILLGIYLLVVTGYDEFRGVTHKPYAPISRMRSARAYLYRIPVRREQNPELFRQFMMGHWIWAIGIEGVGWVLYARNKPTR